MKLYQLFTWPGELAIMYAEWAYSQQGNFGKFTKFTVWIVYPVAFICDIIDLLFEREK